MAYYEKMKQAYIKVFTRLGFDCLVTEAAGGVFTDKNTHEFQVLTPNGEDTIFYCKQCHWSQNKEIYSGKAGDVCPNCKKGKVVESRSIEVGNIFPLGTWYAEKMKMFFADKDGQKKPVWFGSYGIGPTRVMGALVEVFHDDKGIIWPKAVAPFSAHLIGLNDQADKVYDELSAQGIDVLYDDREGVSAGVKFADADLIGIPVRLVVSNKTGDKVEVKLRSESKTELVSIEEVADVCQKKL
jgi:prolyl-tRNA synthetase